MEDKFVWKRLFDERSSCEITLEALLHDSLADVDSSYRCITVLLNGGLVIAFVVH